MLDTSALVAALVEAHPAHRRVVRRLERLLSERSALLLCAHSLAELFAVLTRLPVAPRIGPDQARRLIAENLELLSIEIVALEAQDYAAAIRRMADIGAVGGAMYDMLVVQAALKAKADGVLTLNEGDFSRLCRDETIEVFAP